MEYDVKDLNDNMRKIDIELEIVEKKPVREINIRGETRVVCDTVAKDEKGDTISLTLWEENATGVEEGDRVKITNGYTKVYQGELILDAGRYGKLEVME